MRHSGDSTFTGCVEIERHRNYFRVVADIASKFVNDQLYINRTRDEPYKIALFKKSQSPVDVNYVPGTPMLPHRANRLPRANRHSDHVHVHYSSKIFRATFCKRKLKTCLKIYFFTFHLNSSKSNIKYMNINIQNTIFMN